MTRLHRRSFLRQAGLAAMALGASPLRLSAKDRATPESAGVSSRAIRDFLAAVAGSAHEMHSFMLTRHRQDIARGFWAPYRVDAVHIFYSLSKSFTSTAVGFAAAEGKLKVTDRVIDFFPGEVPAKVSENLAALQIRHLLTMSVGHADDSTPIMTREQDWVKTFLALPIEHAPGSTFLYDSGATYMLSAIVQKVCGEKVVDYLRPRLFDPLQIREARWATCPRGISTGGWGLSATTGTLSKFGRLYLQRGRWNGKQLLPEQWIEQATRASIQQPAPPDGDLAKLRQSSDWHQGYGYQFWRSRHGAYRGDGAFGQYCIVLPKEEATIAITSCTADMQGLIDLVWQHLLPGMHDKPLPADAATASQLEEQLAALTLPVTPGAQSSPTRAAINGRSFELEPNSLGAKSVSLRFDGDKCNFGLVTGEGRFDVACGMGRWVDGETAMPGTPPEITEIIGKPPGQLRSSKVAASGAWIDEKTLQMRWRYYEIPHHDVVTCRFDGAGAQVEFKNSITPLTGGTHPETRPILSSRASKISG